MQGSVTEPASTSPAPNQDSPSSRFRTKAEKRIAFCVALDNGAKGAEAARMVGVSLRTAYLWSKKHRADKGLEWAKAAESAIVTKTQVAEVLSRLVQSDKVDPRDVVTAAKAVSDIMGYNAPTRTELTARVIPESTMSWCNQLKDRWRDAIDVQAIPTSTPPKALGE